MWNKEVFVVMSPNDPLEMNSARCPYITWNRKMLVPNLIPLHVLKATVQEG